MKKTILAALCLSVMALVSCHQEDDLEPTKKANVHMIGQYSQTSETGENVAEGGFYLKNDTVYELKSKEGFDAFPVRILREKNGDIIILANKIVLSAAGSAWSPAVFRGTEDVTEEFFDIEYGIFAAHIRDAAYDENGKLVFIGLMGMTKPGMWIDKEFIALDASRKHDYFLGNIVYAGGHRYIFGDREQDDTKVPSIWIDNENEQLLTEAGPFHVSPVECGTANAQGEFIMGGCGKVDEEHVKAAIWTDLKTAPQILDYQLEGSVTSDTYGVYMNGNDKYAVITENGIEKGCTYIVKNGKALPETMLIGEGNEHVPSAIKMLLKDGKYYRVGSYFTPETLIKPAYWIGNTRYMVNVPAERNGVLVDMLID